MTSFNIRIAIALSAVAFLALIGVQYFLVSNTYQLKFKEFRLSYWKSLYEDYEKCIDSGVMYNDAYLVIDTMASRFQKEIETITDKAEQEDYKHFFFHQWQANLKKHNDLDAFFTAYQEANNIYPALKYAIVVKHLGIMTQRNTEFVVYDDLQNGVKILGNLDNFSSYNNIADTRTAINNKTLLHYTLYVDTPLRKLLLLKNMSGIFSLSLLTILTTLIVFVFTIRNWLRQKNLSDMKSDFINNVSHELKTPLSTIAVAGKSLQNEKIIQNPAMTREMVKVIERQTHRLQSLINQVLDLTVWEKEALPLKQKTEHVHQILAQLLTDFQLRVSDKPVTLHKEFKAQNDVVLLDRFHFTTAINNLLDNGIKYSIEAPHLFISTQNKHDFLEIQISDQGIGMDKHTIQHIFEKFYRGQTGDIHNVKGLGLGLYYVQKSIAAHGGTVEVSSKKGKGSTFFVQLPLEKVSGQ